MTKHQTHAMAAFKAEQDHLLAMYARLPELGEHWLAAAECNIQQLVNWATELQANRFKLCVVGQMNSGKSSLINALLFGRNVLPVYDSVMTSTITLIEHASHHPQGQEGVKVEYYTQEEWSELREHLTADEALNERFTETMRLVREKGVVTKEVVGRVPQILNGFDGLDVFIAIPERGGIYTPFVKQVTLFADHPLLQDLVVVDTPGINDPNQIRARLTEGWMRQADAVVYVTYAGQALSAPDIDFINRFMIHVGGDHRLLAVNKADCVENEDQLYAWLESLRHSEHPGLKQIFSATTPTILVSALGGLLEKNSGPLDEDLEWYRNELASKGYLAPERHRLGVLRAAIDERLIKNRGDALLSSHRTKIKTTCLLVENTIQARCETLHQSLLDATRSQEDLKEKRRELQRARTLINDHYKTFQLRMGSAAHLASESLKGWASDHKRKHLDHFEIELKKYNSKKAISEKAEWLSKEMLETFGRELFSEINHLVQQLQAKTIVAKNTLRDQLAECGVLDMALVDLIIDHAALRNLSSLSEDGYGISRIKEAIIQAPSDWQDVINACLLGLAHLGKEESIAAAQNVLSDVLTKANEDRSNMLKAQLDDSILTGFLPQVADEINKAVEERKERIDMLIDQSEHLQVKVANWKNELSHLETELYRVQTLIHQEA